jgi:hypothetical protein
VKTSNLLGNVVTQEGRPANDDDDDDDDNNNNNNNNVCRCFYMGVKLGSLTLSEEHGLRVRSEVSTALNMKNFVGE